MKIGFPAILFIVFMVLKLTDVIDWSWWWITCPLWSATALALIVTIIKAVNGDHNE